METNQTQEVTQPLKVEVVETPEIPIEERLMAAWEADETTGEEAESTEEATEEVTDEAPATDEETTEDTVEDAEETEEESDESEKTDETTEEESEEVIEIETLHDIADQLGVEPSDLYDIKVPITINGEKQLVTLSEWKDDVQAKAQEIVTREKEQFEQDAQVVAQDVMQKKQQIEQEAQFVEYMLNNIHNEFNNEVNSINWEQLRQTDPAEYAAKRADFETRQRQLEEQRHHFAQYQMQLMEQQQAEMQAQRQAFLQQQKELLVQKLPEWSDPKKAQAEKVKVASYMVDQVGFAPEEVDSIADHRLIVLAEKARKYDELQHAKPTKKKTVKIGKKTLKPGASKSKQQKANESNHQLMKKIKQGDEAATLAYFEKLL